MKPDPTISTEREKEREREHTVSQPRYHKQNFLETRYYYLYTLIVKNGIMIFCNGGIY